MRRRIQCTVFYSWQSDLPNRSNRSFIENALEGAIKEIQKDNSIRVEPRIDRDTNDIPGSPPIAETIFEKIESSTVFVCDVSIINKQQDQGKPTPNPNVLVELGYAVKALGGWDNIIMVMNQSFGEIDLLPFDIKMHRITKYNVAEDASKEKRKEEKDSLKGSIKKALELIFNESRFFYMNPKEAKASHLAWNIKSIITRGKQVLKEIGINEKDFLSNREDHESNKDIVAGLKCMFSLSKGKSLKRLLSSRQQELSYYNTVGEMFENFYIADKKDIEYLWRFIYSGDFSELAVLLGELENCMWYWQLQKLKPSLASGNYCLGDFSMELIEYLCILQEIEIFYDLNMRRYCKMDRTYRKFLPPTT